MDRQALQERFGIIGTSAGVRQALDRVRMVAGTEITVLIQGESGVGKELFAQAIHELSKRRHKKMLVMNCGAMPEGLIESELFGNEKGAYTGAVEKRQGYFEEADGSTIFLDEIGEMPLTAQVRLLRVLETGEFSRVGSSNVLRTDVRVIAATNKDLGKEVEAGRFREDLYYRLSTVLLHVPSLRERRDDILPIFEHFQHRFSQKYNSSTPKMSLGAKELLLRYRWPGNIRELRNVAEQSVVLLRGDGITEEDIRPYLRGISTSGSPGGLVPLAAGQTRGDDETAYARERELIYRVMMELRVEVRELKEQMVQLVSAARTGMHPGMQTGLHGGINSGMPGGIHGDPRSGLSTDMRSGSPADHRSHSSGSHGDLGSDLPSLRETPRFLVAHDDASQPNDFIEEAPYEFEAAGSDLAHLGLGSEDPQELPTLEDAERTLILSALKRFEGNRRLTAESLGISERTLYRKLKDIESTDQVPS